MPIRVIFGKAGSGKTAYCFSHLQDWAEQGGKALLLVPDQATYGVERRFAESLPGKGFAGTQILGFSRLAYRVFQERGKEHQSLSELARQIVLQRLLRKYEERFTVLRTAARQPHFVDTVGQFIWECRSFCIDAADLRQAADGLEGLVLGRKLEDIAVLYEGYCDFLQDHFGDADDVMTLLAREISNYSFLQGAHVWVDGFHWFTPQQLEVLRALGQTAADLTVTLTLDPEQLAYQRRETALFHRSYEVYCRLQELFPQLETHSLPAPSEQALRPFTEDFFQIVPGKQSAPVAGLQVWECAKREVEVDAIARRILQLCHRGYRYRDMLILTRTSDLYNHIVERIFRAYHIPCFSDYRRPMTEHPVAEAISAVLDILRTRWAYEPLFRLLKTDLFPLERQAVDELENYCLAHGIQGYHWLKDEDWTYYTKHFIDETVTLDEEGQARLAKINATRREVTTLLKPLFEAAASDHSLRDWSTLLYHWLVQIGVPQCLRRWQEEDETAGRTLEGKEHEQVWKQILHLFDELVSLCGDDVVPLEEFSQMVGDGLADLKFSLIPPTLDHVTVTAIERGYTMQAKIVFLCGVNDSIFPKHNGDDSLLNDDERERLGQLGVLLGPGSRFRSFQERFLFYVAATRATEQLYLSYSLADEKGSAMEASTWIHQIIDNGYVDEVESMSGEIPIGREGDFILALPTALRYLPMMLRPALQGETVANIWWSLYDWACLNGWSEQAKRSIQGLFHWNVPQQLPAEMVRALYAPRGQLRGSVTKFERYRSCPFAYFSQYGLGLEERPMYRFAAPDLGMLVHGALRLLGEKLLRQGQQWRDLEEDELEPLCRQATEELASHIQHGILMSNAYFGQIKERLIRTLVRTVRQLRRFSTSSHFQMAALEKSFGRGDSPWQPLQFSVNDAVEVIVTGQIDRVDTLQANDRDYVVVIDYKSGLKKLDLAQIYSGLELQLLTYMYVALLNVGGDALPAAILYCYVRDDKTSYNHPVEEDAKEELYNQENKLKGFYLNNSAVMKELDKSMASSSQFLNLRLKKDGALNNQYATVYEEEGWQALLTLASRRIQRIAGQIIAGDISIRPLLLARQSPCRYCPYGAFCAFDVQLQENRYEVKDKLRPKEIIDKIQQEGDDDHGMD